MKKQEIIDAIAKAKKQLAVAKEQDEKDFANNKIKKLEAQLQDAEAEEAAKADISGKKSKAEKPKVTKIWNASEYTFFEDPSHGWLEVPAKELKELGIAHEISGYSYKKGENVYLEEDSDLSVYLTAVKKHYGLGEDYKFDKQKFEEKHTNGESVVRSYSHYNTPKAPAAKKAKTKKSGLGKKLSDIIEAESGASKGADKILGKTHGHFTLVSEGEEVQEVTPNLKLHKISDTVYDLQHKGKSTFEFQKKLGKWHVECIIKDRVKKEGFTNLNAAVIYVAKHMYNEDLKEYFESKKKTAARVKKFKEDHPTGATTAAQTMASAVEKIEDKLTDKVENDESIAKQKSAIVNQIIELLKMLKELGGALSEKEKKDIEAAL